MLFAYRFVDLMCLLVVTNTNWRDKKKVWDYALQNDRLIRYQSEGCKLCYAQFKKK